MGLEVEAELGLTGHDLEIKWHDLVPQISDWGCLNKNFEMKKKIDFSDKLDCLVAGRGSGVLVVVA